MPYLHFLANASLTLRLINHLKHSSQLPASIVTVIHKIDGWLIKITFTEPLSWQQAGDFQAYLQEIGIPYEPETRVEMALLCLEMGQSLVEVMRRYQLAVVCHGYPDQNEIEAFRDQFSQGLGYRPATLV